MPFTAIAATHGAVAVSDWFDRAGDALTKCRVAALVVLMAFVPSPAEAPQARQVQVAREYLARIRDILANPDKHEAPEAELRQSLYEPGTAADR